MMSRSESRLEDVAGSTPSYLELQAYIGTTKHMGGLDATRELAELCAIGQGDYVLDVGAGAGATAAYLAQYYGCRVVGVDISPAMIDLARRRAARDRVDDRVTFMVADARDLCFESALFDAVICESVLTFFGDRPRALREFVRVTKPAGHVGLNEETWRMTPPPADVAQFAKRT
jgi:ubiquinone/menaquinone biosynthesis C-methylase UbiE